MPKLKINFEITGETRDDLEKALRTVITDLCELENSVIMEWDGELDEDTYAVSGYYGKHNVEFEYEI